MLPSPYANLSAYPPQAGMVGSLHRTVEQFKMLTNDTKHECVQNVINDYYVYVGMSSKMYTMFSYEKGDCNNLEAAI